MTADNLVKDQTIHELLRRLRDRFGDDAVAVEDHWEADLFAVGISRPTEPGVLAYISTWTLPTTGYYVDLETPVMPQDDDGPHSRVVGHYSGPDFEQVAHLVAGHLGLVERNIR